MTEQLRPPRRFDQGPATDRSRPSELARSRRFDADQMVIDDHLAAKAQASLDESLNPPRRRLGLFIVLGGCVALGAVELTLFLSDAWRHNDWLSAAWSMIALLAVMLGGRVLARECWRLRHLRKHSALREQVARHWHSETMGGSSALCERLRRDSGISSDDERWRAFLEGDQAFHSDGERLQRYGIYVLAPSDARARALIAREASSTALMVAASPLVWVDMALLAWRSLRLIDGIAALYGLELGYAARLSLFRSVLVNVAFAGASEIASDAAGDALALGLAGRLSTRLAQGLGAGLLTARLGLAAMRLCRPLPFDAADTPGLGDIRSTLLDQLKNLGKQAPDADAHR